MHSRGSITNDLLLPSLGAFKLLWPALWIIILKCWTEDLVQILVLKKKRKGRALNEDSRRYTATFWLPHVVCASLKATPAPPLPKSRVSETSGSGSSRSTEGRLLLPITDSQACLGAAGGVECFPGRRWDSRWRLLPLSRVLGKESGSPWIGAGQKRFSFPAGTCIRRNGWVGGKVERRGPRRAGGVRGKNQSLPLHDGQGELFSTILKVCNNMCEIAPSPDCCYLRCPVSMLSVAVIHV